MTHENFRGPVRSDPALEPCICAGELVRLPDPTDGGIDPVDGHQIELYRCEACGNTLSYDATDAIVRNDYPDARELIKRLAGHMRLVSSPGTR